MVVAVAASSYNSSKIAPVWPDLLTTGSCWQVNKIDGYSNYSLKILYF
ncbi:hypothetical protein [Clostridium pasteurianum]|nr:hypothetical protein [Clostridium pasteurianum]